MSPSQALRLEKVTSHLNRWVVHTLTLLGAKKAIESGITHVICEGDAPFVI